MKTYIEKDGEFYALVTSSWEMVKIYPGVPDTFRLIFPTEKREFEIGSRVYFEGVGWTEVVGTIGCAACAFFMLPGCAGGFCARGDRADKKPVIFRKIEENKNPLELDSLVYSEASKKIQAAREKADAGHTVGKKNDAGKIRPGLIPAECLEEIAKVLTFGAEKYAPDNWKLIDPERYIDALWRHYIAGRTGERTDAESGLLHAAHLATNAILLLYFELHKEDDKTK